jgi:hypothetical protein
MTPRRASCAYLRKAMVTSCVALLSVTLSWTAVAQKAVAPASAPTKLSAPAAGVSASVQVAAPSVAAPQVAVTTSPGAATVGSATASATASAAVATPVPGPSTVSPPAATTGGMDGATYSVRLRDLEARVDELKDQIRRSHTRLALLSDTILSGGAAGSRSEVSLRNEMSSAFRLTRALVVLDGAVQYNRSDDTGALADQKEIPVFSGSVPPGDHTVSVLLNFQGNGYGVFTYLRGYKFEVKSSHSFTAVEGKTLTLAATALEKGGVTTPLEQRPGIEWQEKVQSLGSSAGAGPGATTGGPAAAASGGGATGVPAGGGNK